MIAKLTLWLLGFYQAYLFFTTSSSELWPFALASLGLSLSLFYIAYRFEQGENWAPQAAFGWAHGKLLVSFLVFESNKAPDNLESLYGTFDVIGSLLAPSNSKEYFLTTLDYWTLPLLVALLTAPIQPRYNHLKSIKTFFEILKSCYANYIVVLFLVFSFSLSLTQVGGFQIFKKIMNRNQIVPQVKVFK
jgi:hypothetical protein